MNKITSNTTLIGTVRIEVSFKLVLKASLTSIDYSILHELMHADVVAYKRNGNRHIFDMRFSIKEDPKNWKLAYGAANVKLFARVEDTFRGDWVTQNGTLLVLCSFTYLQGEQRTHTLSMLSRRLCKEL
jgi:hypothetical protein